MLKKNDFLPPMHKSLNQTKEQNMMRKEEKLELLTKKTVPIEVDIIIHAYLVLRGFANSDLWYPFQLRIEALQLIIY